MANRKGWNKKSTLVALRVCATAATGVLLWTYPPVHGLGPVLVGAWVLYLATTIVYLLLPVRWFALRGFDIAFVLIELTLLGTVFAVYRDSGGWLFVPLFLLAILLAALARRLSWALIMAGAVALLMVIVNVGDGSVDPGILILQTAAILTISGLIGYLTEALDHEEASALLLDNALEISTLMAGALDADTVYDRLTDVVARLFRAGRVSVILSDPQGGTASVVSAVDQGQRVHDLKIELSRYPEIEAALERKAPVILGPASGGEIGTARAQALPERVVNSAVLVTPILRSEEPLGVLFVRLEDGRSTFNEVELRFCRLMADVAGRTLEQAERYAEVVEAARRDSLTGLFNVRTFHRRLAEEVDRSIRSGAPFSLLMIDVDYLKNVNDRYGHMAGDRVLHDMAAMLVGELRTIDTVARYGGEEFAVLLPETDAERAVAVGDRLRRRIEAVRHEGVPELVTVSIGTATCPDDAVSASDLLHKADLALYASKNRGRNQVTAFDAAQAAEEVPESEAPALDEKPDPEIVDAIRESLRSVGGERDLMRHLDVIASLAAVMRAKDPTAVDHLRDVSTITDLFVAHLPITDRHRWSIHVAALLRDIGKLAVGEEVLQKRDFLTRDEYETVRQHPSLGAQIVEPLRDFEDIVPIILHHHERWDGKGYPDGLEGDEIPYGARVVGLIDAFYAMIRRRPYANRQRGLRYAIEEIRRNAGTQFDPDLAERFLFVIDADRDILSTLVAKDIGDVEEEPAPATTETA